MAYLQSFALVPHQEDLWHRFEEDAKRRRREEETQKRHLGQRLGRPHDAVLSRGRTSPKSRETTPWTHGFSRPGGEKCGTTAVETTGASEAKNAASITSSVAEKSPWTTPMAETLEAAWPLTNLETKDAPIMLCKINADQNFRELRKSPWHLNALSNMHKIGLRNRSTFLRILSCYTLFIDVKHWMVYLRFGDWRAHYCTLWNDPFLGITIYNVSLASILLY